MHLRIFHEVRNIIIDRVIETESVYDTEKTRFDQNSRTKSVIDE